MVRPSVVIMKWRSMAAAFVASVGAFLFGLDIGYIAPILECPSFKRDVGHLPNWEDPQSKIASATVGFMVGTFSIGCIVSSMPFTSSYFLDTWGRRSSIIMGALLYLSSCVIQARAMCVEVMFLGRFITGLSIGLLSSVVPVYLSEMTQPHIRGNVTSLYQLMIAAGVLVAACLDMFLVVVDGGWRTVIWLQCVPGAFILLCMPFMPRSPRWLVQVGRLEEARRVLDVIRTDQDEAEQEFEEIVGNFKLSQHNGAVRWADVFRGRGGKLVTIGASLQLLQQLCGLNVFMYFGPRIFKSMGLKINTFQMINCAVLFLATCPSLVLLDYVGRKVLLCVGSIGMMLSCIIMGILGLTSITKEGDNWHTSSGTVSCLLVACVFFFVVNFACTWGPTVWVYCTEMYPLKIRARAVGVSTTANWVGNFIIAQVSPMLLDTLGFGVFFIFAVFCFLGFLLALRLPETQGVKLENMDALFDELCGETKQRSLPSVVSYGSVGEKTTSDQIRKVA